MNGDEALTLLRRETGRRTQAELAIDVGVSEGTISRWLNAKSPPKRGLSDLVRWAERQFVYAPLPQTSGRVSEAMRTATPLAELRGQARAVLSMLQAVVVEQQLLVDGLEPWVHLDSGDDQPPRDTSGVQLPTPNATPEELEAATARQLRLDAEAARAQERAS